MNGFTRTNSYHELLSDGGTLNGEKQIKVI